MCENTLFVFASELLIILVHVTQFSTVSRTTYVVEIAIIPFLKVPHLDLNFFPKTHKNYEVYDDRLRQS